MTYATGVRRPDRYIRVLHNASSSRRVGRLVGRAGARPGVAGSGGVDRGVAGA